MVFVFSLRTESTRRCEQGQPRGSRQTPRPEGAGRGRASSGDGVPPLCASSPHTLRRAGAAGTAGLHNLCAYGGPFQGQAGAEDRTGRRTHAQGPMASPPVPHPPASSSRTPCWSCRARREAAVAKPHSPPPTPGHLLWLPEDWGTAGCPEPVQRVG